MHRFTRDLRSLPIWLLGEYLVELGGEQNPDWIFRGAGWQAQLTQLEDFSVGSLRVGQVRIDWQGDDLALERIWPLLEKKLMRAGG